MAVPIGLFVCLCKPMLCYWRSFLGFHLYFYFVFGFYAAECHE